MNAKCTTFYLKAEFRKLKHKNHFFGAIHKERRFCSELMNFMFMR